MRSGVSQLAHGDSGRGAKASVRVGRAEVATIRAFGGCMRRRRRGEQSVDNGLDGSEIRVMMVDRGAGS